MARNENEPRKQFTIRLEESVLEGLGEIAKAQNLSTVDYVRTIFNAALDGEPANGRPDFPPDFGLDAAVMSRIQNDAHALNVDPASYIRTLIYNALTKDPGQDIDELRRTLLEQGERLERLEDLLLVLLKAFLFTSATDAPGHTENQVQEQFDKLTAVFRRK